MNANTWFGIVVLIIGLEVILWEAPLTGSAIGPMSIGGSLARTLVGLVTAIVGVLVMYNSKKQL